MNRRVDHTAKQRANAQSSQRSSSANKKGATKSNTIKKTANKRQSTWFSSQTSFSSLLTSLPFNAWLEHHRFSCVDSLRRLLVTPWQSMMTWLVVAIALVLPTLLYLAFDNIRPLSEQWQSHTQISLYIEPAAKPVAIEQLQQRLNNDSTIASTELITPDMAKQDFQQYSGLGNVLASLDNNPLPYVLVVQPNIDQRDTNALIALQTRLQTEALVETAQLDTGWLRRLQGMMGLAQRIVISLAALLALGVMLIIGNTIRLSIESRRNEIIVVKMVGGTDGFVKRPFLYTGFWYGTGGAVLALVVLLIAELWLSTPIQQLAFLYDSKYTLSLLDMNIGALVIIIAGGLGWLGAWLSVSRHLKHIEPE